MGREVEKYDFKAFGQGHKSSKKSKGHPMAPFLAGFQFRISIVIEILLRNQETI